MPAYFDNLATVHQHDLIGVDHRIKPVGHLNDCTAPGNLS